jgi:hypothetical protein
MPMQRDRYPADWEEIARAAKERAGWCCERCGLRDGAVGYRKPDGAFVELAAAADQLNMAVEYASAVDGHKVIRICLTTAHVGPNKHDKMDCSSLEALCQRCHLIEDGEEHRVRRSATLERRRHAGVGSLFEMETT